jgi:hypothetical protein
MTVGDAGSGRGGVVEQHGGARGKSTGAATGGPTRNVEVLASVGLDLRGVGAETVDEREAELCTERAVDE